MKVTTLSLLQGDWGTQFGMLIQHLDDGLESLLMKATLFRFRRATGARSLAC